MDKWGPKIEEAKNISNAAAAVLTSDTTVYHDKSQLART